MTKFNDTEENDDFYDFEPKIDQNTEHPGVTKNFFKCPNGFLKNPTLEPLEKLVLIKILSLNPCFMGQEKMGEELGLSRRTVQRVISRLFMRNIIRKVNKTGWVCFYVINPTSKWKNLST